MRSERLLYLVKQRVPDLLGLVLIPSWKHLFYENHSFITLFSNQTKENEQALSIYFKISVDFISRTYTQRGAKLISFQIFGQGSICLKRKTTKTSNRFVYTEINLTKSYLALFYETMRMLVMLLLLLCKTVFEQRIEVVRKKTTSEQL